MRPRDSAGSFCLSPLAETAGHRDDRHPGLDGRGDIGGAAGKARMTGDRDALSRMVRNLLDNARRHARSRIEVVVWPDALWVKVVPQPGGFYGGWITSCVVGPFRGSPGSMGW